MFSGACLGNPQFITLESAQDLFEDGWYFTYNLTLDSFNTSTWSASEWSTEQEAFDAGKEAIYEYIQHHIETVKQPLSELDQELIMMILNPQQDDND